MSLFGLLLLERDGRPFAAVARGLEPRRGAWRNSTKQSFHGLHHAVVLASARCGDDGVRADVFSLLVIEDVTSRNRLQASCRAGERSPEGLLRPQGRAQQFLDVMLRLIEV